MQGRKTTRFQLIDATVNFTPKRNNLRGDLSSDSVHFALNEPTNDDAAWVTILIGKNGIGKSRFLASIAETFYQMSSTKRYIPKIKTETILKYKTTDSNVFVRSVNGKFEISVNGDPFQNPQSVPLPNKVIALTTTPFDKFRISNWRGQAEFGAALNCYEYLGLRDRSGRASAIAPLMRAIEGLFTLSGERARKLDRIAGVFSFLGFKPEIEVLYRGKLKEIHNLVKGDLQLTLKTIKEETLTKERAKEVDHNAMAIAANAFLENIIEDAYISIKSDFSTNRNDGDLYSLLEPLRKLRIIFPAGVMITRQDGLKVDLQSASSGEMSLVTAFLGLASVIEDGSLILIDEPEVSLHPEWQSGYIDLLLKTFSDYKGCHFIIATHSPLIVADIDAKTSNVVIMERNSSSELESTDLSGKSSDHILATAFQTPGKNNLYLRQEIIKALRLAADGKVHTEEFTSTVNWLVDLLPKLGDEPSVAQVILNLQKVSTDSEEQK